MFVSKGIIMLLHSVSADQAEVILSSSGFYHALHFLSVFPWIIVKPVLPLRVVIVVVREVDPLRRVGGCAVHEALRSPVGSRGLVGDAVRAFPLEDHDPHQGALVHVWAAFERIEEAQHLLIHSIDLPDHTVAVPREVQQVRNVMFSGDHQGVGLHRAAPALEGRTAIGVIQQDLVVGLALLQCPVYKHAGHVGQRRCKGERKQDW